jgi:hypothetical protein
MPDLENMKKEGSSASLLRNFGGLGGCTYTARTGSRLQLPLVSGTFNKRSLLLDDECALKKS